jgi:hypothetical protein
MRIGFGLLLCFLWVVVSVVPAQEAEPTVGVDTAQQIMDRVIQALGGEAYLGVRDISRRGRLYGFDRGQLASPGDRFLDLVKFPDREWLEIGKKRNLVNLNNGEEGWELDRQGIRDMAPEQIQAFQEANKRDPEYLFRFRLQQERFQLYYLGREIVDNRRVEIVELVDPDNESLKLYVDARTALPLQLRYRRRDPMSGERVEEIERYGKYVSVQGVETPMQISRERAGRRTFEVFFTEVQYNTGLPEGQFTRAALEAHWEKVK